MSTQTIAVHLPDGAIREVPAGTTPLEIANSISPRLAAAAVVARLTPLSGAKQQAAAGEEPSEAAMYAAEDAAAPRLVDLSTPLTADTRLELVTEKDPDALKVVRHSAAHVLATAVLELFPETKLGHGPATDSGFFYDFYRENPFTPEDLARIEARMAEVVARDEKFVHEFAPRDKSLEGFERDGDFMKTHFVTKFTAPGSDVSFYRNGNFVDFCRGPHVPSTGRVKAVKVTSLAGAYWLGDEKNPQLQRIYGTAFFSKKDLDEHFARLEEAAKRDHRLLGKQLDLFSIQELAGAGLIFWHPKGAMIRKIMEDWMREECLRRGYQLVYTPHVARVNLWQTSGHEGFYAANMFTPMELDDASYRMKPMNCPFHILIYKNSPKSYRDLPVRYAELGNVYRYERSGTMHGLLRVRGFTQDDAHIFCTPGQIEDEVVACIDFAEAVLKTFGFSEFKVELSTWDPNDRAHYAGSDDNWELATRWPQERAGAQRHRLQDHSWRSRLLRPQDRHQTGGRAGPPVAALHGAVRLQSAGALRAGVRGRGRRAPPAGHGSPRSIRLRRALLRRAHRALRRSLSAVARAGAGRPGPHQRAASTPTPKRSRTR